MEYYLFCLAALIVAFVIVKKVASCLIRFVLTAVIIAALAAVYWLYFAGS